MMLTIHGLPVDVKYQEIKILIREKCAIQEFILDNLVTDDDGVKKKVRMGLSSDIEGSVVVTQLDGYWLRGYQLRVMPVVKVAPVQSNPAFNPSHRQDSMHQPDYNNAVPHRKPSFNPRDFGMPANRAPRNNIVPLDAAHRGPASNQQPPSRGQQHNTTRDYPTVQEGNIDANNPWGPQRPVQWAPNPVPTDMRAASAHHADYNAGQPSALRAKDFASQDRFPYAHQQNMIPDNRSAPVTHRIVEVSNMPIPQNRTNPDVHGRMEKPITISKDKFLGPTQYGFSPPSPSYRPGEGGPNAAWNVTSQQIPVGVPFDRHGQSFQTSRQTTDKPDTARYPDRGDIGGIMPGNRRVSPQRQERQYPAGNRHRSPSPKDHRLSTGRRAISPNRRMVSPNRRMISPNRRGGSPNRRMISPNRRLGSPNRRMASPGRRMASPGRRMISPNRRLGSPNKRMISPNRRVGSPGRRMASPGRRMASPGRRMVSPGRRLVSPGKRVVSPGRRMASPGRRMVSPGRRVVSPGRRVVSPGRRVVSPGRRMDSPSRRMMARRQSPGDKRLSPGRRYNTISPNRRVSPPTRRISPPTRRISPPARRISPPVRRMSPTGRRMSPPGRRMPSPNRRISPHARMSNERSRPSGRYSPSDAFDEAISKEPLRFAKDVRPAYEPTNAPQHLSSHYRSNEPFPSRGQVDSKHTSWEPNPVFPKDDRRTNEKRILDSAMDQRERDPKRFRSRSPVRRDGSPPYRFRRSPSPKTSRIWEKRKSPVLSEAPPPPAWPGAKSPPRYQEKRETTWERPLFDTKKQDFEKKTSRFDDPIRRDLPPGVPHWDMTKQNRSDDRIPLDRFRDESGRRKLNEGDNPSRYNEFNLDNNAKKEELRRQEFKDAEYHRMENLRREERKHHAAEIHDERAPRGDRIERHSFDKYKPDPRREDYMDRPEETARNKHEAVNIIASAMYDKHNIKSRRIREELDLQLSKVITNICGNKKMSSEDIVMKFYQDFSNLQQDKIVRDVLLSLPSHLRQDKRPGEEILDVVPKQSRAEGSVSAVGADGRAIPQGTYNQLLMVQQAIHSNAQLGMVQQQTITYQHPLSPTLMLQDQMFQNNPGFDQTVAEPDNDLYLCKDDFDPILPHEPDLLRDFLVAQVYQCTISTGWTPTFTFKGLKSPHRYEISPENEESKNWLLALDFSSFKFFDVLVYTKEELWYERAAIWLPGHSKCRHIEPLHKLELQNRFLEGVNIKKWKLVKKIVSAKGTRIYVDIPPSSSRALEKNKMSLSYELQKVNVFLKAIAVDKNAFDFGLRAASIVNQTDITNAIENAPMPSVKDNANIVKICFKGPKTVSVPQAKKIKEMVIYHLFKYLSQPHVKLRTDFVCFGFCQPGYFAVTAENHDSKKWLQGLDVGKLNKHELIVLGSATDSIKYLKVCMVGILTNDEQINAAAAFERLKMANKGVTSMNFLLWKVGTFQKKHRDSEFSLSLEVDVDSMEALIRRRFSLDYYKSSTVRFEHSYKDIRAAIKNVKAELVDSYVVANMEIDSSDGDDDVVALD